MQNCQIYASGNEYLFPPHLQGQIRRWITLSAKDLRWFEAHEYRPYCHQYTFNVCHIRNHNIEEMNQLIQLFLAATLLTQSQVPFCISYSKCFLGGLSAGINGEKCNQMELLYLVSVPKTRFMFIWVCNISTQTSCKTKIY